MCVLGGHKFKSVLKLSNGWADWHQIWHTCTDSSGNGYTPNKLPFETQGRTWGGGGLGVKHSNVFGGVGGHKFKCVGKLSNGSTDWHQIWYMSADSSGNGHRLKQFAP